MLLGMLVTIFYSMVGERRVKGGIIMPNNSYVCLGCSANTYGWCTIKKIQGLKKLNLQTCDVRPIVDIPTIHAEIGATKHVEATTTSSQTPKLANSLVGDAPQVITMEEIIPGPMLSSLLQPLARYFYEQGMKTVSIFIENDTMRVVKTNSTPMQAPKGEDTPPW